MQPPTEGLQHELGRLFAYLGRHIRAGETANSGAYAVLARLCTGEALRATDLACGEGTDASTMSRRLAHMAERGLVERVPDPDDRRAWLVRATEAGVAAFRAERARRVALVTDRVADWEPADVEHLADLIGRLNTAFERSEEGRSK